MIGFGPGVWVLGVWCLVSWLNGAVRFASVLASLRIAFGDAAGVTATRPRPRPRFTPWAYSMDTCGVAQYFLAIPRHRVVCLVC